MNSIIAPNVKRIINERCLKQSAVARKAGYTENQFSAMMCGRKLMKDTDIAIIAITLGVSVNELFKKRGE